MKRTVLASFLFFAVIVSIWEGLLYTGLVSPAALAHPWEIAGAIPKMLTPRGNLWDVVSTTSRTLGAFLISVPIGVILGFGIFYSRATRLPAEFLLDFLRSIPATALVPVFLILFGIGDTTKVAVGVFSSSLVICLSTLSGLHARNQTRLGIATILRISGWRRISWVDFPEALPHIFLGLRTGISLSLILVVVSEMFIGANYGLGKVISDMRYTDDKPRMYAAMILAGCLGYVFNKCLALIEREALHWKGAT